MGPLHRLCPLPRAGWDTQTFHNSQLGVALAGGDVSHLEKRADPSPRGPESQVPWGQWSQGQPGAGRGCRRPGGKVSRGRGVPFPAVLDSGIKGVVGC